MLLHWHAEGHVDPLVLGWLCACLEERYGAAGVHRAVFSWGPPEGPLHYLTLGRNGVATANSWRELARTMGAERSLVVRSATPGTGTLSGAPGGRYPVRPGAVWSWTFPPPAGRAVPRALPSRILYPSLPAAVPRRPGNPQRVTLLVGGEDWAGWQLAPELTPSLRGLGLELEVLVLPAGRTEKPALLRSPVAERHAGVAPPPALPDLQLGSGGVVVFCGGGPEWVPHVLGALAAGRLVLAPRGATYASYLEGGRGVEWGPPAGAAGLLRVLAEVDRDPSWREAVTRRAAAWARRWTLARTAGELEQLALSLTGDRPARPRPQPEAWILRREIGIGDVVFGLCAAEGLKRRDPACRITFHTAPEHAGWVARFPCVDRVTSGLFEPPAGVRVVDWEKDFPSTSLLDRATAMGQVAGIEACWPPAPRLPSAWLRSTRALLPRPGRPRIAFVPASKGSHVSRTLPAETACELAELLQHVGNVVWLEAGHHTGDLPRGVTDLSGRLTLPEVVGVLAQCDVCVSVDSGLLFLAAALGKPVVGMFSHIGALQRLWHAPRFVALQPSLPCAPCGEGPDAFPCLGGTGFRGQTVLPCIRLPWKRHLAEAVRLALAPTPQPLRKVWNLAPNGERLAWEVDTLPPPWLLTGRDGDRGIR